MKGPQCRGVASRRDSGDGHVRHWQRDRPRDESLVRLPGAESARRGCAANESARKCCRPVQTHARARNGAKSGATFLKPRGYLGYFEVELLPKTWNSDGSSTGEVNPRSRCARPMTELEPRGIRRTCRCSSFHLLEYMEWRTSSNIDEIPTRAGSGAMARTMVLGSAVLITETCRIVRALPPQPPRPVCGASTDERARLFASQATTGPRC